MKALILNSGMGRRMGSLTKNQPKCMTEISPDDTIISRQLKMLKKAGIKDVVVTTGPFEKELVDYCKSLELGLNYTFVNNPKYDKTNYIYSIYLAKDYLDDDLILMHGDLVFVESVLQEAVEFADSCMIVSTTSELPDKDFKAVLSGEEDAPCKIKAVGIEFFENAVTAQPLYKLNKTDWLVWLDEIKRFCENGKVSCYAENAFNEVSEKCNIYPIDIGNLLCNEIDTAGDLGKITKDLKISESKTVYMCFSTDIIHAGHINILNKAATLGGLTVGILSDKAVASYKRFPLLSFEERKKIIENISCVSNVVEQKELSYARNLKEMKPDYVVHGDDWKVGFQKPIRNEVVQILNEYGGELIEFSYDNNSKYSVLEQYKRSRLSIPEMRRGRLRKLLAMKKLVTVIEAHNGITGLIAENTKVLQNGKTYQFDGIWVSSLCDSTCKGKPDIELVDMSSRIRTIDDIMEVTTKPIILDGDTGGLTEHFIYNVKTLERMGVSAIIIEDKTGLKKNSLFGTQVVQAQDSIENFCKKISAGKKAQKTKEFMIIARIESLILEQGMEDALKRAFAFVQAGADGIMIHSRKKMPDEIFEFVEEFRKVNKSIPIVVVPTAFNSVTEDEFEKRGVNIVIYANHLIRSSFPAMQKTATSILENHRAKEADEFCMPIKDILSLIPEQE
ncbi:MAG TPA: phosphoenolpyruvate mutase [Clostridia bacterium]|nr:phosphoenolpyruvate mutase [Clostridia bacterium]